MAGAEIRTLHSATWSKFGHAVPIALLNTSIARLTTLLRRPFEPAGDPHPGQYVSLLRLRTGETVALLGPLGREDRVTLLTDATGDPAEVIEHFVAATGIPADKVASKKPKGS